MIGLPFEHSWLGLEAWWPGKIKQNTKSSSCTWSTWLHLPPGSLHQRGQVWSAGPVLPGVRLLHDGEQHDDDELARDHPGDAALEEGLPLNLQQSRPGRDTLSNFCRLLISGAKPNMAMFSTSNCFQEVAEICFLRLNLLLVAVEARKYEGGSIDINPNGKKITPNAIGLFISDSSDKVKRAWFYCRLVFEAKKLHSHSFVVVRVCHENIKNLADVKKCSCKKLAKARYEYFTYDKVVFWLNIQKLYQRSTLILGRRPAGTPWSWYCWKWVGKNTPED